MKEYAISKAIVGLLETFSQGKVCLLADVYDHYVEELEAASSHLNQECDSLKHDSTWLLGIIQKHLGENLLKTHTIKDTKKHSILLYPMGFELLKALYMAWSESRTTKKRAAKISESVSQSNICL